MKRYLTAFLAAAFLSGVSGAAFAQSSPDAVVKAAVEGTVKAMQADPQARGGDMAQITKVVETHFGHRFPAHHAHRYRQGLDHGHARAAAKVVRAISTPAREDLCIVARATS
jgi:ABC-type transporter MlaC component